VRPRAPRRPIDVDGRLYEKNDARHIVSAWVSENHIVFGQLATETKISEVRAIPKLVKKDAAVVSPCGSGTPSCEGEAEAQLSGDS
jgi:hypothetical protein